MRLTLEIEDSICFQSDYTQELGVKIKRKNI